MPPVNPTTPSIDAYILALSTYRQFINFYTSTGIDLQAVISNGTALYNDPSMPQMFPTTWPAYQAYLVNLNNVIQAFLSSIPTAPPLNG